MIGFSGATEVGEKVVPEICRNGSSARCNSANYLLLTTSLLVDRVFLHTGLIDTLAEAGNVTVWAASMGAAKGGTIWSTVDAKVESFPAVRAFKEIPHNYLRRLNEFIWDYRYVPPSRMSMLRHIKSKKGPASIRALRGPARLLAGLQAEKVVENSLEKLLLSYTRSEEAEHRLRKNPPSVIVSTGPFQFEQPGVFSAAKKLNIPTLAYIPSWDNVSTKNRMVFKYDGYIVWNENTKKELIDFYPHTAAKPIYVVGAPQFDVFRQERFYISREEFCRGQGLDPSLPVILYAVGSPNFLQEHHGALHLANRIANGHLGNVQMLVRPHPIHDNAEMKALFDPFLPSVRLQTTPNAGKLLTERTQDSDQVIEWVNTFRHADVLVNLSSTVTIDAAIFGKPVVNLDFDPQPGGQDQQLIKDINHRWTHFKPIAESGGVWLVENFDELENAIKCYLKSPSLHQEQRERVVEHVCGYTDGSSGERMANAIIDFAARRNGIFQNDDN